MSHEIQYILFGAGSAGKYTLTSLTSRGIHPVVFADNNSALWGTPIEGIPVMSPIAAKALAPDATWVCTVISAPAREIRAEIKVLGVRTIPLHEVLPCFHGLPSEQTLVELRRLVFHDALSTRMVNDQIQFRGNPDYDAQEMSDSCADIYFPDFIQHLDCEHFLDIGGASGDTVESFLAHWTNYKQITAFEPDKENMRRLTEATVDVERIIRLNGAVGDTAGHVGFVSAGDFSSHLSRDSGRLDSVMCYRLDDLYKPSSSVMPTYIKMDIEGSELEALWGARRILKEHKPALAICAYHTSDNFWEIPFLIHAIQPDYKLFFRRYGEGAFELVWYGVPPDRVQEWSSISYSDNHEG